MKQVPLRFYVIHWLLAFFRPIFRLSLRIIYFRSKKEIPPIKDSTLMQSAQKLAKNIRSQKQSSFQIVKSHIERIKELQPLLNAIVDNRFEKALEEATEVDNFVRNSGKSEEQIAEEFPFLGVPFTCKESLPVKGLSFTSGSLLRKGMTAEEDAEAVQLLRKAGAIPLAVTIVPEMCLWFESHNLVYGRCNNPYDTRRTPGGSSGGEGALLSSAGTPLSLGTDFAGSVRVPAHFCGLFAHKCTTGSISTKGHHPMPTVEGMIPFLCVGAMTRYGSDIMPLFKVLVTKDKGQQMRLDEKVNVALLKYYYIDYDIDRFSAQSLDPEINDSVSKIVRYLKGKYGITAERLNLPNIKEIAFITMALLKQPTSELPELLANGRGSVNATLEIFKKICGCSSHTFHGINSIIGYRSNFTYGSSSHNCYLLKAERLKADLEKILGTDGVLIFPSYPTAAQYHHENHMSPLDFVNSAIFNVFGFPATQFPTGLNREGLPIGLQVASALNQDRLTIAVAEEMESVFGGWIPPS